MITRPSWPRPRCGHRPGIAARAAVQRPREGCAGTGTRLRHGRRPRGFRGCHEPGAARAAALRPDRRARGARRRPSRGARAPSRRKWSPWVALAIAGTTGPTRRPRAGRRAGLGRRPTSCSCVRGHRRAASCACASCPPHAARRPRRAPAACPSGGGAPARDAPADHPPQRVGRRLRAAARGARVRRGAGGLRAPHGDRERLRAGGIGGHRARHRALPPRLQRVERHRLQLPRRPVRPGVRGPRGRDRPGCVGAQAQGYNSSSTGIATIGHVQRPCRSPRRGFDALAQPDRLEALAARRADQAC